MGILLRFQIAEPSVVERLALGSLAFGCVTRKRIQLFLDRGGT